MDLDLRGYVRVVWKRKWFALAFREAWRDLVFLR